MRQTPLATTPAQLFLTVGWLRAGVEKAIDPSWWSGDNIRSFIADQQGDMLPFVRPLGDLLDGAAAPFVAAAVLLAELLIAINLGTSTSMRPALRVACALNVCFMMFGVVSPSVFYLIIQITLLRSLSTLAPRRSQRRLVATASLWAVAAVVLLPFVRTLHPQHVIHDPAITLSTVAALVAVTAALDLTSRGDTAAVVEDLADVPPQARKTVIVSR